MPPVLPGTMVASRYLVVGVLGAGGMGVVYRAHDQQLQRDVALKLCARGSDDDARRLLGEALALARLSHANVIHVYEVGHLGDDLFVVMELVTGGTLRAWRSARRRSWLDVVRIYLEAARGLHAVHRAGLVHGDFKPDNVLVGADGRVRLVDFGLARVGEDALRGGGGTPRYMAPEVRAGWYASQRSDQFSFCAAMNEALGAARRPRGVTRALARGLADDADARHDSMAALRRELARALARRRQLAGLAAAVVAVLALATAGAWVTDRAESNRARAVALRRAALELDVVQGRRELADGNPEDALVYLSTALSGGLDRPAVRFLLARGLAALEQSYVVLSPDAIDPVTAVHFVRRGPQALVGDVAGRVFLFDKLGRRLRRYYGVAGRVGSLALDGGATRLLAGVVGGPARVWNLATGASEAELPGGAGAIWSGAERVLTWAPSGLVREQTLAAVTVRQWQVRPPVAAAVARGDDLAVAAGDGVHLLAPVARVLPQVVPALAVDLEPGRVASGGADGLARVFDARTGALLAELRHPERVGALRFLGGDRLLTACDDGLVRVWDLRSGAVATTLGGHTGPVTALEVTPDGDRVITGSSDGTARVWDLASGRQISALSGHRKGVRAVAVAAPDALVLSGSDDGTARIWAMGTGGFVGSLGEPRYRGAWFSGRDAVVALDDGGAVDLYRGSGAGWERMSLGPAGPAPRRAATVTDDGSLLAVTGDRRLELWDLEARQPLGSVAVPGAIAGVRASADGRVLLAYGAGAWVWRAAACGAEVALSGHPIRTAALSPLGDRAVLASEDGGATILAVDGSWKVSPPRPPAAIVEVRFDPSGTLLAVGGDDGSVWLWDVGGFVQRRLGRHGSPVVALRFSPDGALLHSLGSDRKVRVWDVASGAMLAVVAVEAFGGLEMSPDGARLLVSQSMGRVSLWDVSREPRSADAVASLVRCLVPLGLDENGRVVDRPLPADCR